MVSDHLHGFDSWRTVSDASLHSFWRQYDDNVLEPIEPVLGEGENLHMPISHDEVIFRPNELCCRVWTKKGQMPLQKKNPGRAIYNSGFIVEQFGRLAHSPSQVEEQYTYVAWEQTLALPWFTRNHFSWKEWWWLVEQHKINWTSTILWHSTKLDSNNNFCRWRKSFPCLNLCTLGQ